MQRAETPSDLHSAALEAARTKTPIPAVIKNKITVWIGDRHYLPLAEWYRQNAQIPAIIDVDEGDHEDDELFMELVEKLMSLRAGEDFYKEFPMATKPRPTLASRIKLRIKSFFSVDHDIKFHASI